MTNLCLLAGGIAGWWASIEDAMAEATVAAHATYIENYTPELLNDYKY